MNLHTVLIALLVFSACSTPKNLNSPKDFKFDVNGLYIECTLENKSSFNGELIEVNPNIIRILPVDSREGLKTFIKDEIKNVEIFVSSIYDNPKKINSWSTLMPITSIGHGFWGVITLPINISTAASMNSSSNSSAYRMKYPDNISWTEMSKFARFPQGIPENIDLNLIE